MVLSVTRGHFAFSPVILSHNILSNTHPFQSDTFGKKTREKSQVKNYRFISINSVKNFLH